MQLWHLEILNVDKSQFLKSLIYGKANSDSADGIHLRGAGASRNFTYRVVQAESPCLNLKIAKIINPIVHRQSTENPSIIIILMADSRTVK